MTKKWIDFWKSRKRFKRFVALTRYKKRINLQKRYNELKKYL